MSEHENLPEEFERQWLNGNIIDLLFDKSGIFDNPKHFLPEAPTDIFVNGPSPNSDNLFIGILNSPLQSGATETKIQSVTLLGIIGLPGTHPVTVYQSLEDTHWLLNDGSTRPINVGWFRQLISVTEPKFFERRDRERHMVKMLYDKLDLLRQQDRQELKETPEDPEQTDTSAETNQEPT